MPSGPYSYDNCLARPSRRVLLANITSRLGPLSARHLATRRSKVRRTPTARSGCRRQISSKIAMARTPGAASSIGTISPSHTRASGSGRRRPRGLVFCDGNRGSASIRYAVAVENPAFAARDGRGMASTGLHVQPRLAVGDVSARQATRSAAPAAVGATSPAQQMTTRSKRPAARYHQPKERHHPGSAIAGPLCHRRTVLSRIDTVERRVGVK